MSTTTEKLVVSRAIDIYGVADEDSVTKYITAMYGYIHPNRWKTIYQEVLDTCAKHGYSSPVDFCEDLRLDVARKMYMEKALLYNRLLEGEEVEWPEQHMEHDWNIGDIEKIDELSKGSEDILDKRLLYPTVDPRIIKQHVEAMSKWQSRAEESRNGVGKAEEKKKEYGIEDKERRRFYHRMSNEEKELDDFLDRIEEEHYNMPQSGVAPNRLREKYPILKASPIGSGYPGFRMEGSDVSLENQYRAVVKKILGKTMHGSNDRQWRQELRIIVQYHMRRIGMVNEIEKVNALIDSSTMSHTLMNILMLLQELVERPRNQELVQDYLFFKKDILMFGNYYRK